MWLPLPLPLPSLLARSLVVLLVAVTGVWPDKVWPTTRDAVILVSFDELAGRSDAGGAREAWLVAAARSINSLPGQWRMGIRVNSVGFGE